MDKLGICSMKIIILNRTTLVIFLLVSEYSAKMLGSEKIGMFKEPQISLKRYMEMDSYRYKSFDSRFHTQDQFQNEFVSKNGSDFVISDEALVVEFTCEASYPIAFNFPHIEQIGEALHYEIRSNEYRLSEVGPYHQEPANLKFMSVISIISGYLKFLSVNLTCSSVESKPELWSSIYIFLNGNVAIEHEEQTLQIFAEPSTGNFDFHWNKWDIDLPPLIVPCRPASPDMNISLEKEMNDMVISINGSIMNRKYWTTMNLLKQHITFDPKVGIAIQRDFLRDTIFGLYRCSASFNGDIIDDNEGESFISPFVYFNVTKTDNSSKHLEEQNDFKPFQSKSIIRDGASVHLDFTTADYRKRKTSFTCCTGTGNKPPKVYIQYCTDPLMCKILGSFIAQNIISEKTLKENSEMFSKGPQDTIIVEDCSKNIVHLSSAVIMCKGENVDYLDYFVSCFHPLAGGPVANRSERIIQSSKTENSSNDQIASLGAYESATFLENNAVSQKMIILVARKISRKIKNMGRPIYIQSSSVEEYYYEDDDGDEEEIRYSGSKDDRYLEYNRDFYYQGESLTFICFGLKLAYAIGPRLALNWENGTTTRLEPNSTKDGRGKRYVLHKLHLSDNNTDNTLPQVHSILGRNVTAMQGVSSVDCLMPKQGSSMWDKISKPVKVLATMAPKFEEKEEEALYFYLEDTGKVVTCTVSEGTPLPRLKLMRNGKRMKINWRKSGNETKFPTVGTNQTGIFDKIEHVVAVRIQFAAISHDHQAVFQCVCRNVNSTITRTIKIFVIDKPSMAVTIFITLFAILLLILAGLGLKHWYYKRHVQNMGSSK